MENSEREKLESISHQVRQLEEKSGELERAKNEAESRVSFNSPPFFCPKKIEQS